MNYAIIAVRELKEFHEGHGDEELDITPTALVAGAKQLETIATDSPIIIYCRTSSRSNGVKQSTIFQKW